MNTHETDESILLRWMQIAVQFPFQGNCTISAPETYSGDGQRVRNLVHTFNQRIVQINADLGATNRENGRVTFFHRNPPERADYANRNAHAFFNVRERVPLELVDCVGEATRDTSIKWPTSTDTTEQRDSLLRQALEPSVEPDDRFRQITLFYLRAAHDPDITPHHCTPERSTMSSGWTYRIEYVLQPRAWKTRSRQWKVYPFAHDESIPGYGPLKVLNGAATALRWLSTCLEEERVFPCKPLFVDTSGAYESQFEPTYENFALLFARKCIQSNRGLA